MCILKLSEVLMYEFHYDNIWNKHDNKSELLFTETHSLMYEIKTEDQENIRTQCYIKIIKISIGFSTEMQSSLVL